MPTIDRYTSDKILAMPIEAVAYLSNRCTISYSPTEAEVEALQWIGDRYAISGYLLENLDEAGLTIDPLEVSRHLAEDGVDRVPCLDESTALARLIWAVGF
ncbi:hypothetical protein [Herbaspirillum sp.]|uniref:hypothetical protein n=1 Tax=Herbaspirillum sp. TaxID=1890675 RepID=UPI000C121A51|nr:hypothetical protein [Herbaspirillum sp.]MBO18860.1 hypothetical protein [Herbaspirillum sp.]